MVCLNLNSNDLVSSSRYPPYSDSKLSFLSTLLKKRQGFSIRFLPYALMFGVGVASALIVQCITEVGIDGVLIGLFFGC